MGTQYEISKKNGIEIELSEMSNKFALCLHGTVTNGAGLYVESSTEEDTIDPDDWWTMASTSTVYTPEEIILIAAKMVQVASYWMPEEDDAVPILLKNLKDLGMVFP